MHTNKKSERTSSMRTSGILLPVFSLPSPYGIGCFSDEARKFIDFLCDSGQSYWQILPLGPTTYGDSPYQSPSAFAGNPYFIDIDTLCKEGLLTSEECESYKDKCPKGDKIDYGFLYRTRHTILRKAFDRFAPDENYLLFEESEKYWLGEYCEFAAVKEYFGGRDMREWDEEYRSPHTSQSRKLAEQLIASINYHKFLQYEFMKQWCSIKNYANSKGIRIIGDMPIYTAMDSVELRCKPELFLTDREGVPAFVAGCPPDSFSPDGQLWGSPIYDWYYQRRTGFDWWIKRMNRNAELFDMVRIDHFRGLESYYAIPYESKNAKNGKWYPGPGAELFDALQKGCPNLNIIAEDLGFITDDVKELLSRVGCPGMKVVQFAFDSMDNDYMPHNYIQNSVVYTGTHDNPTCMGWAKSVSQDELKLASEYMGIDKNKIEDICRGFIRLAMSSVSDMCILPIQDILMLGDETRINVPSTLGGNWCWRLNKDYTKCGNELKRLTAIYGRDNKKGKGK